MCADSGLNPKAWISGRSGEEGKKRKQVEKGNRVEKNKRLDNWEDERERT